MSYLVPQAVDEMKKVETVTSRLIGIVGGCWGIGGDRPRGSHLLAIHTPKCPNPKIPPNFPENTSEYVLQDYRGVGGCARLPAKPISLVTMY